MMNTGIAFSRKVSTLILVFFLVGLVEPGVSAASEMFTLLRKIRVDSLGTAGAVDGCAFSTAGDLVAASDNHGNTKIYRVEDGTFVMQVHHAEGKVSGSDGETNAIHFSPDDRHFLTGMNDTGCKIWKKATGELVVNLGHGTNTDGAAFSPDGRWLAAAQDDLAVIYNLQNYQEVARINHPRSECNTIDWSSDSGLLVTGSDGGSCKITRTDDWTTVHAMNFGVDRVKSVRISPKDSLVAVAGQAARVRVYRVSDGIMVADLPHYSETRILPGDDDDGSEPNVEAVEWSSDSRYLFTGGLYDGVVRAWRVADWSLVGWTMGQAYNRQVEYMAVNPENIMAIGGDEGYLYLYEFHPSGGNAPVRQSGESSKIIIEAEQFTSAIPQGTHHWKTLQDESASGGRKLQALPHDDYEPYTSLYPEERARLVPYTEPSADFQRYDPYYDSPKLDYRIKVDRPGLYYLWIRGRSTDDNDQSVHGGLNGVPLSSARAVQLQAEEWSWSNTTGRGAGATLDIREAGVHTLHLWMGEAGVEIDKLILTPNVNYVPDDEH